MLHSATRAGEKKRSLNRDCTKKSTRRITHNLDCKRYVRIVLILTHTAKRTNTAIKIYVCMYVCMYVCIYVCMYVNRKGVLSVLTSYMSPPNPHTSPLSSYLSPLTSHPSRLTYHPSPLTPLHPTSHPAPRTLTSHLSPLTLPSHSHICPSL